MNTKHLGNTYLVIWSFFIVELGALDDIIQQLENNMVHKIVVHKLVYQNKFSQ